VSKLSSYRFSIVHFMDAISMIDKDILARGIEQGIITHDQAERLRLLGLADSPPDTSFISPDDEQLRLITGFSDIFVTIGLALFLGAIGYLVEMVVGKATSWFAIAAAAWLLAEYFTRIRRMALPSIVLLIVFAASVFIGMTWIAGHVEASPRGAIRIPQALPVIGHGSVVLAALACVLAAAIHYWRFRVPITIAAGNAALIVALISSIGPFSLETSNGIFFAVIFACGIAVFALAMYFDMSDRNRKTRRTDIAFWLHLLAAPLIVHPILKNFIPDGRVEWTSALIIITIFLALGLIAVLIDRRALLVSGLAYAGYAVATLMFVAGFRNMTIPLTLLALGSFVLLLSAGWTPLRVTFMRLMPPVLSNRLPPIAA
jgi:hypothetical protein